MRSKENLENTDIRVISWYLDSDIDDVTYSFTDKTLKRHILEYNENDMYSKVECFNAFSVQYVDNEECRFTINDVDAEYWFNELVIKPGKRCVVESTCLNGIEIDNVTII